MPRPLIIRLIDFTYTCTYCTCTLYMHFPFIITYILYNTSFIFLLFPFLLQSMVSSYPSRGPPSFSLSAFNTPVNTATLTNLSLSRSPFTSPFYAGRTSYGGASSSGRPSSSSLFRKRARNETSPTNVRRERERGRGRGRKRERGGVELGVFAYVLTMDIFIYNVHVHVMG